MKYLVYREELVGSIEAPSWGQASFLGIKTYGDRVIRVSPAAGVLSEDRVDRERAALLRYKEKHPNNDGEQDGA